MRGQPSVRLATLEDRARLHELAVEFLRSSIYGRLFPGVSTEPIAALVDLTLEHGVGFVAEVNGRIVGMLGGIIVTLPLTGERMLEETAWFVVPDHRNSRVGPLLLEKFEQWAYKSEAVVLKMMAPFDRPEVSRYYGKHGYSAVEVHYLKRLQQ